MDNFPESEDNAEEDYSQFEDQYADDLKMVDELEAEHEKVDFDVAKMMKIKPSLCKNLNSQFFCNNTTAAKNIHHTAAKKRHANTDVDSEEEYLKYSSDDEISKKEISPKSKKLKLTDEELPNSKVGLPKVGLPKVGYATNKPGDISYLLNQLKSKSDGESLDEVPFKNKQQQQYVFHRPLFGEDSINVTSLNGHRVFLRLNSDVLDQSNQKFSSCWFSIKNKNLLATPFEQLKQEVEDKRRLRLEEKLRDKDISRNHSLLHSNVDLWVEKYSPKRYTDLLSDDGINRILLRWLKLWDNVVFNKNFEKKKVTSPKKQQEHFKKLKETLFLKKFDIEDELTLDTKGRPKNKVVLLCGNPGLGKTTLAHVISTHAGYNVVEMNASDDRSPEIFLDKIESATQMKAVLGEKKRPNCLVIDEIDGAPEQAINTLLNIVKATNISMKLRGKKKKKQFLLNRPIICICNNQFVPALRELRKVALTLTFPLTIPARLASRLLKIAHMENLHIDMTSLLLLCERTENDIRACLNTLQFFQQKSIEVKSEDIKKMAIGIKDMSKDARTIVSEVFQLPPLNKKQKNQSKDSSTNSSSRFHYMLHLASGGTDFDKITQGLFDHYLNAKIKDPYLESINCGCNWLEFTDFLESQISSQQEYTFLRYMSFLPVAFHMYYARAVSPKLTYSNVAYENYLKITHNQQTYQLMVSGMPLQIRRHCSLSSSILDLIPFLFFIVVPNLRPVNTQLYSESEKQMFQNAIDVMISYNLTYRQERNSEGQYTYLLEPNIEELTTFSNLPQHRHLPYATKQLIAREVEMEKMRRAEGLMKPQALLNEKPTMGTNFKCPVNKFNIVKEQPSRTYLDFFGRTFVASSNKEEVTLSSNSESKIKPTLLNNKVFYRFNEGFTNAVRRTVKTHELV